MTAAVLTGLGTALPARLVTNEELSTRLDTTDEWIRTRTGIGQRFWSDGESTGDLAVRAGERALAAARVSAVDMVVLATTTPDHPCPATAPEVASRLGLGHAAAFDIAAVCSGFVYALAVASAGISAGLAGKALVIGSETYSTILDPEDRTTSVIFGDGAGAVVLERGETGMPGSFAGFDLGSDGANRELIQVPGGGSRERTGADGADGRYFTMRGKAVFKEAVTRMAGSASKLLESIDWAKDSVDLLVGHQANTRILHALADHLGVPRESVVVDLDRVGNTSAASIPLALARAAAEHRLRPGDRVLLSAFGGGLTWGSTALVWPELPIEFPDPRRKPMSQHVMDRLVTILTGQLDVEETQLTADTEFEELGLDSLVLVELSVILHREFGVEVTDEELAAGRTLGSAAAVVSSRAA